ncbi:MAG: MerR family transcriptional regulator [Anaerolineales bacterium]|jgi:DNA-binding transcriptional MerR regulator
MLDPYRNREFDLNDLVRAARSLISAASPQPSDGRVAEFPDSRTIRYYQTVGLVSHPARYDGRNAVYEYRHLLQIVAVKLLQAQGLSLAQVQKVILRATSAKLENELSRALEAGTSAARPAALAEPPRQLRFRAATASEAPPLFGAAELAALTVRVPLPSEQKAGPLLASQIAPGVTVIIDATTVSDPEGTLARLTDALKEEKGDST